MADMQNLTSLTAQEMASGIRRKEISPVELVQAHLKRIERLDPMLHAFVTVASESALDQAQRAEETVSRGEETGPLHGVPITVKSCIDVKGMRCETGSALRAGNVPEQDATLVARLKQAGAIILGNTNAPEMLMSYETDNEIFGRTNNPWDVERTPGGSSGGESAAIAAGCSAGGVGSDGGGSIRVPAHFSGICGLKPTPGRIPATGHYPASFGPFTKLGVVGPMARTVGDVRLLYEVMAGPDWEDVCSAPVGVRSDSGGELKGLRIGYFEQDSRVPVTAETRAAVKWAAQSLEHAGCVVNQFCPDGLEEARRLWDIFFCHCATMLLAPMMKGRELTLPILAEYAKSGHGPAPATANDMLNAWIERDVAKIKILRQMEEYPVLVCAVCAVPAFRHGERNWTVNGQSVTYLDAMSYTQWWNLLGFPAAVVQAGQSPEGLPIGVQVVGRPWQEEIVLAVAEAIEKECGRAKMPVMKV